MKNTPNEDTDINGFSDEKKTLPFSIFTLNRIVKKPLEDLVHYIANYFNSQQDYFCLLIVTRDSPFVK